MVKARFTYQNSKDLSQIRFFSWTLRKLCLHSLSIIGDIGGKLKFLYLREKAFSVLTKLMVSAFVTFIENTHIWKKIPYLCSFEHPKALESYPVSFRQKKKKKTDSARECEWVSACQQEGHVNRREHRRHENKVNLGSSRDKIARLRPKLCQNWMNVWICVSHSGQSWPKNEFI